MKHKYHSYYILKCDIKKYFYNIDKTILFNILKKHISDTELLNFTGVLLESDEQKGIPIGNYTSQYFANIYLNELDHYIKEELGVAYYVRYMDDFVLLLENKVQAKIIYHLIEVFLQQHLHLELNSKSKYYPSKFGCNFCGYVVYETHILLRKRFKLKVKKNIKRWNQLYLEEKLNISNIQMSWNSILAHASHACSYHFISCLYQNAYFCEQLKDIYKKFYS